MLSQNFVLSRKSVLTVTCLVAIAFVGCIAIPLGDPEKAKVDDKLVGAWISKPADDGKQTLFTVVPWDARTCSVTQMGFEKDGDAIKGGGRFDWKMWLVDVKGTTFAALEMKNPQLAVDPQDKRFTCAKIARTGDTLTLQMVKDDFVSAAKTSAELEKLIGDNLSNAAMFDDALTLTRVGADQKEAVGKIMEAFNGNK